MMFAGYHLPLKDDCAYLLKVRVEIDCDLFKHETDKLNIPRDKRLENDDEIITQLIEHV